jgi:hypothetical protein
MTWQRQPVAQALVSVLGAAVPAVSVHPYPPETLNGPCVVVMRPQLVTYSAVSFSIDEASLPLAIVSGIEQEDQIDAIRDSIRKAVEANPTLGGVVQNAYPAEERNWRNVTGAGGIQLLMVEFILTVVM